MGVSVYQNTFAKVSSPTLTQTITGIPFRPKTVIFWTAGMTGTSFLDGVIANIGFTDGTNHGVVACASEDGSATSDGISLVASSAIGVGSIILYNAVADALVVQSSDITFTADGFTIDYLQNDSATTDTIHYMAIGGDDITNVKVGIQTIGTAVTGNKSYTGVGFRPDFLLTASNGQVKASAIADGETVDHCGLGISAMKSTTERWAISNASEGGRADSDTWRYHTNTKCFALLDNSTGTKTGEADFVSFGSDGFTWNYTTTGTNITNSKFIYLAIKGGVWDVGDHIMTATDGTITTNTNASATLKGVMLMDVAIDRPSLVGVVSALNLMGIGGSDGTRQSVISYSDLDANATMVSSRIQKTTNAVYISVANATAASSTSIHIGTVAFNPSSFAITYTASNLDRLGAYFAVSEAPSGVPQAFGEITLMLKRQSGGKGTIFG